MGRVKFEITDENFYECKDLSKEIFWMYHDIAYNGCIVCDIDYEQVDFKKYIMCEIVEERLKCGHEDKIVKLVNEGCFTALSCYVLDIMEESLKNPNAVEIIDNILEDKKIENMKFEKELLISMRNALNERPTYQMDKNKYWTEFPYGKVFNKKLSEVYTKYVIGYYKSMISGNW